MGDLTVRSDSVDVEQIMRQIRARIREKRGIDYTEEEIRQLASVKLEKFLEPGSIRSDLLQEFQRRQPPEPPPSINYSFEEDTIFASHRSLIRWLRGLFRPLLKLLFNPGPIVHVLNQQSRMNAQFEARLFELERKRGELYFELMHNLVLELTKLGIEVKNLKMRVESLSSRLDFDERRARALEGVVQYKPGVDAAQSLPSAGPGQEPEGHEERRRRRRRRRRRGGAPGESGSAAGTGGAPAPAPEGAENPAHQPPADPAEAGPEDDQDR